MYVLVCMIHPNPEIDLSCSGRFLPILKVQELELDKIIDRCQYFQSFQVHFVSQNFLPIILWGREGGAEAAVSLASELVGPCVE